MNDNVDQSQVQRERERERGDNKTEGELYDSIITLIGLMVDHQPSTFNQLTQSLNSESNSRVSFSKVTIQELNHVTCEKYFFLAYYIKSVPSYLISIY